MLRLSPARRATVQRITLPLLVLASAMIIALGKSDRLGLESLRNGVMDAAAPTLEMVSQPALLLDGAISHARDLIAVYQENAELAAENERLLVWQQAALRLASENAELRNLLKLAPEPAISYLTARVIASSGGTYVRNVIVNAGSENGVARGQAAITGDGLIGRVTEVGDRAARILLITDLNSRVPVIVESSRRRAVLTGDNSERPSLRNMEAGAAIRIGDRIVTSGEGGVFPPGLPVGIVAAFDGEVAHVEPNVALSLVAYLRLVDYGRSDLLPGSLALAQCGVKRPDRSLDQPVRR
jgi:rod shape-determining protein MreC